MSEKNNATFFDKTLSLCPNNKQTNNFVKTFPIVLRELFRVDLRCVMKEGTVIQVKQADLKDNPFRFTAKGIKEDEQILYLRFFEEKSTPHDVFVATFWYFKMNLN